MPTFPNHSPDLDSGYENEALLLRSPFGDGYYQAVGDGVRPYTDKWTMRFNNRPWSVVEEIKEFLDGLQGASFDWQSPLSAVPTKWKFVSSYEIGKSGPDAFSIEFVIDGVSL